MQNQYAVLKAVWKSRSLQACGDLVWYGTDDFNHIDSLVHDCSNSAVNALELLQPCAKLSIYHIPATLV